MSELRKLAEAVLSLNEPWWDLGDARVSTSFCDQDAAYIAAANPATVIGLMDEIDRLRTEAVAADIGIANDALVIAELTAERDDAHKDLGNLLAIIHRDGGHYAEEHGKSEAYDQAVAVCASYRQAVDILTAERDATLAERDAALAERDAKLAALEGLYLDSLADATQWQLYKARKDAVIAAGMGRKAMRDAAAGAAPAPEDWRSAVAMAYGHLWHVNNEPMAPIPLRSEESASYAARKLLRDLLTAEERGEAINAVQKLLAAAPKEPT